MIHLHKILKSSRNNVLLGAQANLFKFVNLLLIVGDYIEYEWW